jgi:hypothetical protein
MSASALATGDLIRLQAHHIQKSQDGIMDFAYRVTGSGGASLSLQAVADEILSLWRIAFPPFFPVNVVLNGISAALIDPLTSRTLASVKSLDNVTVGTDASAAVPGQVGGVIRKTTAGAGPSNRGRVFWPFLPFDDLSIAGEWIAAKAILKTAALGVVFGTQVITIVADSVSLQLIILHHHLPPLPYAATHVDVVAFESSDRTGTQRRRGDFGRQNAGI